MLRGERRQPRVCVAPCDTSASAQFFRQTISGARANPRPMRTPIISIVLSLVLGAGSLAAENLQIMTVGDSITALFQYQPRLKTLLNADTHQVTFVGKEGTAPNKHEGYSGENISPRFIGAIPLTSGQHYITTALDTA